MQIVTTDMFCVLVVHDIPRAEGDSHDTDVTYTDLEEKHNMITFIRECIVAGHVPIVPCLLVLTTWLVSGYPIPLTQDKMIDPRVLIAIQPLSKDLSVDYWVLFVWCKNGEHHLARVKNSTITNYSRNIFEHCLG